ncbi:MAG: SURF1 family protein [Pseudomonadota bacterium]
MIRRLILPLLFGLLGTAVLAGLGFWQLQRLAWKEGLLTEINQRIGEDPVPLPRAPEEGAHDFMPVTLFGAIAFRPDGPFAQPIRVFGAWRGGRGYRIVVPVETDGRRVLVDLGIVPLATKGAVDLPDGPLRIVGNLAWPDEVGPSTPVPSHSEYYARDVPDMARFHDTEPVLVVARTVSPEVAPRPSPVGTEGIPNNHLGYAIQWFGLALVWAGMTLFLLWRIRRRTV